MFPNLKLKPKTLKITSVLLTFTGIIFILGSNYIGSIALRIAMVIILLYCSANIKMTYKYMKIKDKAYHLLTILSSIIGLYKPELTMFIIGILLLFITVPPYVNIIKSRDYSDIVILIANGIGILFGAYCIINSKAALNTVIIIIGIALTITGCLSLFDSLLIKKSNNNYNKRTFEDTSNT